MRYGNCFERAFWSAHTLDSMMREGHEAVRDIAPDSLRVVHAWCIGTDGEIAGLPMSHGFVEYMPADRDRDRDALVGDCIKAYGEVAWRTMCNEHGSVERALFMLFGLVLDIGNEHGASPGDCAAFLRTRTDVWRDRCVWPAPMFYGIGNVGQHRMYTLVQACALAVSTEHTGPWDDALFPCSAYDADGNPITRFDDEREAEA